MFLSGGSMATAQVELLVIEEIELWSSAFNTVGDSTTAQELKERSQSKRAYFAQECDRVAADAEATGNQAESDKWRECAKAFRQGLVEA
jgi:hypothetical protein